MTDGFNPLGNRSWLVLHSIDIDHTQITSLSLCGLSFFSFARCASNLWWFHLMLGVDITSALKWVSKSGDLTKTEPAGFCSVWNEYEISSVVTLAEFNNLSSFNPIPLTWTNRRFAYCTIRILCASCAPQKKDTVKGCSFRVK